MNVGVGVRRATCLLAVLGAGASVTAFGAVDGLQIAREQKAMSLHWEPVVDGARLLSGHLPAWDAAHRLHVVDLRQGTVAIHVPAHAMLRVQGIDASSLSPVFAVSHGTGLAIQREPLRGVDGQSWLLRTGSPRPAVIHLMPREDGSGPQRHALFLARYEPAAEAVTYRHDIELPGTAVRVRRADQTSPHGYVRLAPGDKLATRVQGPDRLMVEYRLAAPESPTTALPLLQVGFDGTSAQVVRQPTGPENVAPVQVDGVWQASSRLERVAFDVPAGEHTLELQSTHGLLIRARAAREPDLLLPRLNFPERWEGVASATEIERLEQASIAAAESNAWRDSGRLAGERLRQQARLLPGQRSVQAAADELIGQFVEFHDLSPSNAVATRVRPILIAEPHPPDEPVRHQIRGPLRNAAPQVPTLARFHQVTSRQLPFRLPRTSYPIRVRALVHADSVPGPLEVRDDTGRVLLLMPGMSKLPGTLLNIPALTGLPDPLTPVAAVDWELPVGTTSFSVRTLGGELELALQWAASTEYFPDDEFLARHVAQGSSSEAVGTQQLSAVRPFPRMLAAAYAQYVANIAPARPTGPAIAGSTQDTQAQRAAAEARRESEPARAVALWQPALHASDPALRAEALQGLARAMRAAGERFAGERVLRSHWIGTDPALARAAQQELHALYALEGDRAMQLSFSAAVAHKDPRAYPLLSTLLAVEGEDRLAILAGLSSPAPDLAALTQSALRARLWQTFDALVQRLPEQRDRQFWKAQHALAWGRDEEAQTLLSEAGSAEWEANVREARTIAQALQGSAQERSEAVAAWTSWQARHPGPRHWRQEPESLVAHAGSVVLRSVPLNLRSQWWRASEAQPLAVQVVGPARIRIETRPLHRQAASLLTGWLRVRSAGQLWLMPFHQNQPSPGLEAETADELVGAAVTRDIDLPPGLHDLRVDAGDVPIAARLFIERPVLQLAALAAPTPAHFRDEQGVAVRRVASRDCGATQGCELLTGGARLQANTLVLESTLRAGLPPPAAVRDPLAEKLAAGDIDGALALTNDPPEKMRLLLWLAQTRPSARARALALGAQVAAAHPTPEIRSQWEQLSQSSGWSVVPVVDRSAGLRRVEGIQGAPESPEGRIRAALLAPLRPGELRLGPDTRATLVYQELQAVPLRIDLAMDEVPGLPALPITVSIERNGSPWQTVRLEGAAARTVDLRLPPGQQTVSVSLREPYLNQFVRARFSGPVQPELTSTRDWHIATASEPVRVTLAGPVAIRIDHLEADAVRAEERVIAEPQATIVLRPRPGQAETLYRVFRRQLDPVPSAGPTPRPNAYKPEPLAEAPAEWRAPNPPDAREVRFLDDQPLSLARDHTLSIRASVVRRRDTEGTGGGANPPAQQFIETGATWRKRSDDETWAASADALVRKPATGSPVLGLRLATEIEVPWHARMPIPFTVEASLTGFAQSTPDGLGASLMARITASQKRELAPTITHTPTIGVMTRWLSLGKVTDRSPVDTDIFTAYRASHPRALLLGDTLSWRPWRDTHFSAQVNLVTNPNFNFLRPDHLSAGLQWRQLVGPAIVEASVRATRYLADANRAQGVTRWEQRLAAGAEWWLADGTRLELKAQLRHDASAGAWGGIELHWHSSSGRQLRDFGPSEIDFRSLRSWRAPNIDNGIEER